MTPIQTVPVPAFLTISPSSPAATAALSGQEKIRALFEIASSYLSPFAVQRVLEYVSQSDFFTPCEIAEDLLKWPFFQGKIGATVEQYLRLPRISIPYAPRAAGSCSTQHALADLQEMRDRAVKLTPDGKGLLILRVRNLSAGTQAVSFEITLLRAYVFRFDIGTDELFYRMDECTETTSLRSKARVYEQRPPYEMRAQDLANFLEPKESNDLLPEDLEKIQPYPIEALPGENTQLNSFEELFSPPRDPLVAVIVRLERSLLPNVNICNSPRWRQSSR